MIISKDEYESLNNKIKNYEQVIDKFTDIISEINLLKKPKKKIIIHFLYLVFSFLVAVLLIIITDYLNSTAGIFMIIFSLTVFFILYALYFPIFVISMIRLLIRFFYKNNYDKQEYPQFPKSFKNKDGKIFNIEQFFSGILLDKTHFSREEIKMFTYTNCLSIFSGIIIYFIFIISDLDFISKSFLIIYLIGVFIITIILITNRLN